MSQELTPTDDQETEWLRCLHSRRYFIHNYVKIYKAQPENEAGWIPFHLWPAQVGALRVMEQNQKSAHLKARQVGLTWLALAGYALHTMLFYYPATILIFSARDEDAQYLLDFRLKGMYNQLPRWLRVDKILKNDMHNWRLSNESYAKAFPANRGDSYTASVVIIDEAGLIPDLDQLMKATRPTVDGGGKMIMIGKANKEVPDHRFHSIYRSGRVEGAEWKSYFIPWYARPGRTPEWYEKEKATCLAETFALDELYENYPATDEEAMAPMQKTTRLPHALLEAVFEERLPVRLEHDLGIPGLIIYKEPQLGVEYVATSDTAEGLPNSDDSVTVISERLTGEEVAIFFGKIAPDIHAGYTYKLAQYYMGAGVMVERQNHGQAFILAFKQLVADNLHHDGLPKMFPKLLPGQDGREGWSSTASGKILMYDSYDELLREAAEAGLKIIHTRTAYDQLGQIQRTDLKAPPGKNDDLAVGMALSGRARLARTQNMNTFNIYRNQPNGTSTTPPGPAGTGTGRVLRPLSIGSRFGGRQNRPR